MTEPGRARIWGFIIANREWDGQIKLEMGMSSFGRTSADAWRRHIGHEKALSPDFPILVQRWSDRGYLPVHVCVELASSHSGSSGQTGDGRRT